MTRAGTISNHASTASSGPVAGLRAAYRTSGLATQRQANLADDFGALARTVVLVSQYRLGV
jgi:hypothetical protein